MKNPVILYIKFFQSPDSTITLGIFALLFLNSCFYPGCWHLLFCHNGFGSGRASSVGNQNSHSFGQKDEHLPLYWRTSRNARALTWPFEKCNQWHSSHSVHIPCYSPLFSAEHYLGGTIKWSCYITTHPCRQMAVGQSCWMCSHTENTCCAPAVWSMQTKYYVQELELSCRNATGGEQSLHPAR